MSSWPPTSTEISSPAFLGPGASGLLGCGSRSAMPVVGIRRPRRWSARPGSLPRRGSPGKSRLSASAGPPTGSCVTRSASSPLIPGPSNVWVADLCNRARARGHDHPHAVRVLARAWLHVIWRCWQDGVSSDPAQHNALQRLSKQDQPSEGRIRGVEVDTGLLWAARAARSAGGRPSGGACRPSGPCHPWSIRPESVHR